MNEHPTYPIRHGVPAMDRCICGGVRHWHALAPNGCDDCDCEEFALDESWRAPVEPPVLSRAAIDEMIKTVRVELGQEGFNIDKPWDLFWRGTDKLRDAILESLSQEDE